MNPETSAALARQEAQIVALTAVVGLLLGMLRMNGHATPGGIEQLFQMADAVLPEFQQQRGTELLASLRSFESQVGK